MESRLGVRAEAGLSESLRASILGLALAISGVSGLVNQVVWQRSLRVYLAGSESLSGMIVVLVFLLGLSLGAYLSGRWSQRVSRTILAFAAVEFSLSGFNLLVSHLLHQDLSQSVFLLKSLADWLGLPLIGAYTLAAILLLLPPCTLMGATTPLAAECIQRIYKGEAPVHWISRLLFLNTLGACLGALVAGGFCLPVWGQSSTLLVASGANCLAGLISLAAYQSGADVTMRDFSPQKEVALPVYSRKSFLMLGFVFGFVSLLYEMWLLRALALAWEPLPSTFAACLSLYLFFWNLGVSIAGYLLGRIRVSNLYVYVTFSACFLGLESVVLAHDRTGQLAIGLRALYFVPCVFSGLLYASLASWVVRNWGGDTGAFLMWNTLGSCLGVLLGQMLGYQIPLLWFALMQMAILIVVASCLCLSLPETRRFYFLPLLSAAAVTYITCYQSSGDNSRQEVYCCSDGVLELRAGRVYLDSLVHSSFDWGAYSNDWFMGALPALVHARPQEIRRALVVGFGLGRTVDCLRGLPDLQEIDTYEINRGFRLLFEKHPEAVANILNDPRVHLFWQDGRSGIALAGKRYDLISSAPLYLKQSGSSLMLSENYFRLLLNHLNPGGTVACYSRAETALQGLLVRQTFARVFPYTVSAGNGYLLLGSNAPIEVSLSACQERLALPGKLFEQARGFSGFYQQIDQPRLAWDGLDAVISDDRPLVEYEHWIPRFLKKKPPFQ